MCQIQVDIQLKPRFDPRLAHKQGQIYMVAFGSTRSICLIYYTHTLLNILYTQNSQPTNMQSSSWFIMVSWHKGSMARAEPLIKEADPHITKLANRCSDVG